MKQRKLNKEHSNNKEASNTKTGSQQHTCLGGISERNIAGDNIENKPILYGGTNQNRFFYFTPFRC